LTLCNNCVKMRTMKRYKVKVTIEFGINASSKKEAKEIAHWVISRVFNLLDYSKLIGKGVSYKVLKIVARRLPF